MAVGHVNFWNETLQFERKKKEARRMPKWAFLLFVLFIGVFGCSNYSQTSKIEKSCFPDGTCIAVSSYMNGGIVAGKQIVVVDVKECKKAGEAWTCTRISETKVHVDDGTIEKAVRATFGITKHSGKSYYEHEGDNISSGSGSSSSAGAAAASISKSNAKSKSGASSNSRAGGSCRGRCD